MSWWHTTVSWRRRDSDSDRFGLRTASGPDDLVRRGASRQGRIDLAGVRNGPRSGGLSHDLWNPLNVAQGRLGLTQQECESEHLDTVDQALGRMKELINGVLLLARARDAIGETTTVDLAEIAGPVGETSRPRAPNAASNRRPPSRPTRPGSRNCSKTCCGTRTNRRGCGHDHDRRPAARLLYRERRDRHPSGAVGQRL
ncbi:MAG: histidine kinase dimerization/phospho-acceptor domain-containing protein [Halobacteriales archaeon]